MTMTLVVQKQLVNVAKPIALMRVFPKAFVLTIKSHFDVKERMRQYEAWWSGQ